MSEARPHCLQGAPWCVPRKWYFSRQEIEDCSPSRKDGISLEKESQMRKSYCTFLQELGKRLKIPQVTIACAMLLCHRFYIRQSHTKNDSMTIGTASMFLACKIEDMPRKLKDVVIASYEIIFKCDPYAAKRVRQTELCKKQMDLILLGENLLLTTVAFDVDIHLPYRRLSDALNKMKMSRDLGQVSWNFVNDWLCTTLCLQYKPHCIAAGSVFLAAKLQKVKLPTGKGRVWWLEFDISPKQLEEVIQEMLRLLEVDRENNSPPRQEGITKTKPPLEKVAAVCSSPQSTITGPSITTSHSSDRAVAESKQLSEADITERGALPHQPSDRSSNSIVEDAPFKDETDKSSTEALKRKRLEGASDKGNHRIDPDRIRELFKRRRCREDAKKKTCVEALNPEIDSDAWIEKELEDGIVLS